MSISFTELESFVADAEASFISNLELAWKNKYAGFLDVVFFSDLSGKCCRFSFTPDDEDRIIITVSEEADSRFLSLDRSQELTSNIHKYLENLVNSIASKFDGHELEVFLADFCKKTLAHLAETDMELKRAFIEFDTNPDPDIEDPDIAYGVWKDVPTAQMEVRPESLGTFLRSFRSRYNVFFILQHALEIYYATKYSVRKDLTLLESFQEALKVVVVGVLKHEYGHLIRDSFGLDLRKLGHYFINIISDLSINNRIQKTLNAFYSGMMIFNSVDMTVAPDESAWSGSRLRDGSAASMKFSDSGVAELLMSSLSSTSRVSYVSKVSGTHYYFSNILEPMLSASYEDGYCICRFYTSRECMDKIGSSDHSLLNFYYSILKNMALTPIALDNDEPLPKPPPDPPKLSDEMKKAIIEAARKAYSDLAPRYDKPGTGGPLTPEELEKLIIDKSGTSTPWGKYTDFIKELAKKGISV